jgi:hypothetical protein
MAENPFLAQLLGVNTSPYDTTYGQLSEAIGGATPRLVNPYASPGRNLASVAGAGLLAGLLGYQAKREAETENRAVLPQLTALLGAKSPEEMAMVTQQEAFPSRMLPLAQSLMLNQYTAQQEAAAKQAAQLAELEAKANFELGPLGTQLFERDQEAALRKATASASAGRAQIPKALPTAIQERIVQHSLFSEQAQAVKNRMAGLSEVELKAALTAGTSGYGLFSDPGFVQEMEAVLQLYRSANFGQSLTGGEQKAANIISGKSLTASKADILAAWDTLINQSARRAQRTLKIATSTPEEIGGIVGIAPGGLTQVTEPLEDEEATKLATLAELQRQEAELDKLLAAPGQ